MKTNHRGIEKGDVLLLSDGRMARVENIADAIDDFQANLMLEFMDKTGYSFQPDDGTLDVERNLGQSDEILSNFYTARSIHAEIEKLFHVKEPSYLG